MGTALPPNEDGNLCDICWGLGKAFGETPTPKVIQLRLTSLLPGDYWEPEYEQILLATHYLEQTIYPCLWEIRDAVFLWSVHFRDIGTAIDVDRRSDSRPAFKTFFGPVCGLDHESNLVGPALNVAWNGFANITWDTEGLT